MCPMGSCRRTTNSQPLSILLSASLPSRSALVLTVIRKSFGFRIEFWRSTGETLSPQLQVALAAMLSALEAITARIREYDAQIEKLAEESYPDVALLKQVKGVGTLTYILTLEDPRRFRKSRDAGCYIGLQPGRRNSGQSEPQLHITREGDSYLRMVLVQGAQHILGPFGEDSDLRRWGLKLAERGGKRGKRRAIVAVARKLAVLLHHLWISCEAYEPLHNVQKRRLAAA